MFDTVEIFIFLFVNQLSLLVYQLTFENNVETGKDLQLKQSSKIITG